MTDTARTVSERLRSVSHDLRRLSPCSRNPERYHDLKRDLIIQIETIAKELQGERIDQPAEPAAPRCKIGTGSVQVRGRVIPVVRR